MNQPTILEDIDSLAGLLDADDLIGSVLKQDVNLQSLLSRQEADLEMLVEGFVSQHCDEAENLCAMYTQITDCEDKLVEFEKGINEFLDRLTETADEVVGMQQETEELNLRVENRKRVKNEVTMVYGAVNDCGKFCEDVVSMTVEKGLLAAVGEYESKLEKWHTLRERNKGLVGSAIDEEIRPKLEVAASRVGDKLQRHFAERFGYLKEPGVNVALHQQLLEKSGQGSFRFLTRYNKDMADQLRQEYVGIIRGVYGRSIRTSMKDLAAVTSYATLPFEAVISPATLKRIATNQDLMTLNSQQVPSGTSLFYSRNNTSEKERGQRNLSCASLSRRLPSSSPAPSTPVAPKGALDQLRSIRLKVVSKIEEVSSSSRAREVSSTPYCDTPTADLKAVTFEQQIRALRAIHILEPKSENGHDALGHGTIVPANYMGLIVLDPIVTEALAATGSWTARFIELLTRVVNAVTTERQFMRNFILGGVGDSRKADLEEEDLMWSVFRELLNDTDELLQKDVPLITDSITLLTCLRAIELMKNFVFKSPSPNPILLLSGLFETATNGMRRRIISLLQTDTTAAEAAGSLSVSPVDEAKFVSATDVSLRTMVLSNPPFALALGVHPTVQCIARITSKLHALNCLQLNGSYVHSGADVVSFDEQVGQMIRALVVAGSSVVKTLSKRYDHIHSGAASIIFHINNVGHLLYQWLSVASASNGMSPLAPLAVAPYGTDTADRHLQPSEGNLEDVAAPTLLMLRSQELLERDGASRLASHKNISEALLELDRSLKVVISSFVRSDVENRFKSWFVAMQRTVAADEALARNPDACPIPEAEFMGLLTGVSTNWQDVMKQVATSVRELFDATGRATKTASSVSGSDEADHEVGAITSRVLSDYYAFLVEVNGRLVAIAKKFYGSHSTIQAKVIGRYALEHELKGLI